MNKKKKKKTIRKMIYLNRIMNKILIKIISIQIFIKEKISNTLYQKRLIITLKKK